MNSAGLRRARRSRKLFTARTAKAARNHKNGASSARHERHFNPAIADSADRRAGDSRTACAVRCTSLRPHDVGPRSLPGNHCPAPPVGNLAALPAHDTSLHLHLRSRARPDARRGVHLREGAAGLPDRRAAGPEPQPVRQDRPFLPGLRARARRPRDPGPRRVMSGAGRCWRSSSSASSWRSARPTS